MPKIIDVRQVSVMTSASKIQSEQITALYTVKFHGLMCMHQHVIVNKRTQLTGLIGVGN